MNITASRKDDILQRKKAYEDAVAHNKAIEDEQDQRFRKDTREVLAGLEDEIRNMVSGYNIPLNIRAERHWNPKMDKDTIEIRIGVPERGMHEGSRALTWDWRAWIDEDGEVRKESSSWSGMSVITMDHIQFLQDSVEVLKLLVNTDWEVVLNRALPEYNDYFKHDNDVPVPEKEDFDSQLFEAELSELIGTDTLVVGCNPNDTTRYRRDTTWYKIIKETPKQFTVAAVPNYLIGNPESVKQSLGYTFNISKDKLKQCLAKPLKTMEV